MKKILCFLVATTLLLTGCGQQAAALTWQEQYDLGVRYLSEGNYEEAILAFDAAIQIDPKQPEAYVQLAEIYTELGEMEKLSEILDTAKEQFGEEKFIELFPDAEAAHNPLEEDAKHSPIEEEPYVVEEVKCLQKEWTESICCFHVPRLNLPGGLGQEFNTQIQQKYNDFSADYFARSCSFDWYQHEDVLTIIVREFANAPCTAKQVYSISVETGKELTDAEILKRCGITEAEFADKVDSYMGEFLQKTVWDLTNANIERDPEGAQWYTQDANWAVEEAYSEGNMKNVKPYIGQEGQLCFVFYVPGVIQNDDYFLVDYHTGETYSVPACEDGHGTSSTVAEAYPQ